VAKIGAGRWRPKPGGGIQKDGRLRRELAGALAGVGSGTRLDALLDLGQPKRRRLSQGTRHACQKGSEPRVRRATMAGGRSQARGGVIWCP
jgi:hypothetical protein